MNTLELVLARFRIRQPDHIFPGFWLDERVRKEQGVKLPIREVKENSYNLHGCYVWFQPENSNGQAGIMYAGKATRLCNRHRITGQEAQGISPDLPDILGLPCLFVYQLGRFNLSVY